MWDWIIKLECGTGIVYWLLLAGTDNKSRQGIFNYIPNLVLNLSLLDE